eukprot:1005852-Rhodomonas_salina.1
MHSPILPVHSAPRLPLLVFDFAAWHRGQVPLDAAPFDEEQRRILMSKYTLRAKTSKESGTTISDG